MQQKEQDQKKPKQFKITEDVLQATINYLANKPYIEVQKLIPCLQNAELIIEKPLKK